MGIVTKFNSLGKLPKISKAPIIIYYNLTINPTPSNAIVTMNGQNVNSMDFEENTIVQYQVSQNGYITKSGTVIMDKDYMLNVNLDPQMLTVTINPTPADATVTMNGVNQKAITAAYNTNLNWSVTAPYYVAQSGSEIITNSYTKNIVLQEKSENILITQSAGLIAYGTDASWINDTTVQFKTKQKNMTLASVMVDARKSTGIVSGACQIVISCNPPWEYDAGVPSGWKPNIYYILNSLYNSKKHLEGISGTIILGATDKLVAIGLRLMGDSYKFTMDYYCTTSFTCKKLIA